MSSMRPDNWMPLFWGDYARDTGHLNNAHHGAYLMLIKHYWCTGLPLPDDDDKLWRISCCDSKGAWKKLRSTVEAFFEVGNGVWRHKRIDEELGRAKARTARRAEAGSRGAAKRWQTHGNANGNAMAMPSNSQWQNDG